MANDISIPDPNRFDLTSFADILPARDPITGEDPGSFEDFHHGMMRSLAPVTPYESVIAENLIAIEWELLQHRRMHDACLRQRIRRMIGDSVKKQRQQAYEAALDEDWERHVEAGGDDDNWERPFEFDKAAATAAGADLAARAMSRDRDRQTDAYEEIAALGLDPVSLMGEAFRAYDGLHRKHDQKVQELERRRREVKRDYDALQKARPIEGEVIDG